MEKELVTFMRAKAAAAVQETAFRQKEMELKERIGEQR
jgi:hypothetical protein